MVVISVRPTLPQSLCGDKIIRRVPEINW